MINALEFDIDEFSYDDEERYIECGREDFQSEWFQYMYNWYDNFYCSSANEYF